MILELKDLSCEINSKKILSDISLQISEGEVHVIMGPNGSGKSTIAKAIVADPDCKISSGKIYFEGHNITDLTITERANKGIFMAYQTPIEVPGLNFRSFARLIYNNQKPKDQQLPVFKFKEYLLSLARTLNIPDSLIERNLNEGLSGGEKKKLEILQMALRSPKLAILDETDSGLDIEALKTIFSYIKNLRDTNPNLTILVITHYHKIFEDLIPDKIHIMIDGKIVKTRDSSILQTIEKFGYEKFRS